MYTAHYNLRTKPFQISSDAAFMWLGEKHKEALATLKYGILDNKGFLLLTGDVGTGKTTLINTLIASLSNDVIYASIPDPSLEKMDFFNYIATTFNLGEEFSSKGKFISSFSKFLHEAYENNKKVLLIIDESQLMTQELLEETRLLSNIVTKDSNPLLNIFFVGQYEFNELIRRPENRAIAQRLTLNYYIEPLTFEETGEYIRHRLKIAGTTERIFNASAIREIYAFSNGFPRRINIICDHCLMSGYAEDLKTITGSVVKESSKDLRIPESRREPDQVSRVTEQQSLDTSTAIAPEPIGVQINQPTQLAQVRRQRVTGKFSFFKPIGSIILVILVLMSCYFFFPDFINNTYEKAIDYLTLIQGKTDLDLHESSGKPSQPELQGSAVSPGNEKGPETLTTPEVSSIDKTTNAPSLEEQTTLATSELVGKPKVLEDTPKVDKKDVEPVASESKIGDPAVEEKKTVESVSPESVTVQHPLLSKRLTKKTTDINSGNPSLPLPEENLVLRFKNDSNIFSTSDIEKMKEFARVVKVYPKAIVNIFGYTDSIGDEVYNKRLSQFRANMVKSFLMGQNLLPEQIRAQGLGSLNPVDRNDTAQGRMMNRRVEVSVIEKGDL
jgi:general secretion pathway protein A